MRILHVVRQFHPSVGGLEEMVMALASQQRAVGLEADVLTLDRLFHDPSTRLAAQEIVRTVPVHRVPYAGSRRYPIAPAALSHMRRYDLVHVHGVDFFCDYLAVSEPIHRKPLVISTHGGFFHTGRLATFKHVYFRTITRLSLSRYRRVFACSEQDRALFAPVAGPRVRLIENGVNVDKFAEASSAQFQPTFVYFGRFASHKGLDLLLDAFARVSAAVTDARLLLLGNDWDGTLGPVREKIDALGLVGRVRVATGLSDDDLRREIGQATFFVSASQYEGFGLALVEALSAGLIPIASRIPSHQSIVSQAGLGLLTDFSNAAVAAQEIVSFLEQSRGRHVSLRTGAVSASRRYSWDEAERHFRDEYEGVLGVGKRTILGVGFVPMQRAKAVDTLDRALTQGQPLRVAFANANTLTIASRDERLRSELANFLVLNDGIGVDIAGRLKFGRSFPENLNGTDFVPHFLDSTRHRLRIYLVGARPSVIGEAASVFAARWPRHTIVGACHGFFTGEEDVAKLCDDIRDAEADVVLVGLGDPLQEHWIVRYGERTGAKLLIGVGALFDFVSGKTGRAPAWIRRMRCEWIYRLLREPRRLARRYLVGNLVFFHLVLRDRWRSP